MKQLIITFMLLLISCMSVQQLLAELEDEYDTDYTEISDDEDQYEDSHPYSSYEDLSSQDKEEDEIDHR